MKITFLGAGICQSPTMVNSGILLADQSKILVDCCGGAEIVRQLHKLGLQPQFLKNPEDHINHVLITHRHPDHMLGIIFLLFDQALSKKITVTNIYCSKGTKESILRLIEYTGMNYVLNRIKIKWVILEPDKEHKLSEETMVTPFRVEARNNPGDDDLGFVLLVKDKKIVFSGDTKPCEGIVKYGKDCDLLIHECFSTSDYDAHQHGHSTAKDVGEIATKMNAKRVIITHICFMYYDRVGEIIAEVRKYYNGEIEVAEDLAVFNV